MQIIGEFQTSIKINITKNTGNKTIMFYIDQQNEIHYMP
jgi:hypothetical protein